MALGRRKSETQELFVSTADMARSPGHPFYGALNKLLREGGTNEQTNGVMRQFLPKGTSFAGLSQSRLARIEDLLNNRPRKCLGYRTPAEVIPTLDVHLSAHQRRRRRR